MAVFILTAGVDNFTGIAGQDNTFQFTPLTLQSTDTVTGGATGVFIDILSLTAAGTITAAQFAGVSNVERLDLPGGGNTVILTNGLVAGSSLASGFFIVTGGSGDDIIDGSAITNGKRLQILSAGGGDLLKGGSVDDVLDGGSNNDQLEGGDGNDTLFGGTGVDGMIGGIGNDTYFADSVGDTVVENAGEGTETVYASLSYALGANVEQLYLLEAGGATTGVGNGEQNLIVGNSFDNALDGGANNDQLEGGGGNDTLDGGTGVDGMIGGAGNDTYFVDSVFDVIVENAGEGIDTVYASLDYMLGANVEQLFLREGSGPNAGVGNGEQNLIVGNSEANILDGGANNDQLEGGGGSDTLEGGTGTDGMIGGDGNDTYFVDSVFDVIVENANEGIDTVYTNSNYIIGANVEQLYLLEAGGATTGVGNGEQNLLVGNSFANALDGGANNDTLMAGGGNDTLFGGIGADAMSGEAGNDTILIADSNFAMIDGGADLDRITLNTPGQTFDLTANAAKISNVEVISLNASAGASLSLTNTDIPTVNAAGNSLYVLGGIDDTVNVGDTWIVISITHTNPAVAAGVTFIQYHNNTTNSELYIADTIPTTISTATNNTPSVFLNGSPDGINLPDGVDHAAAYTTGNAAGVAISDVDATVDDPDTTDTFGISSHIADLTVTITDPHSGALEYLVLTSAGHTIVTSNSLVVSGENTHALTIAGSATDTVYQDLLREIRYVNTDTSVGVNTADRHVTVEVQDGVGANSNIPTATIALTRGNNPPTITSDGGGDDASLSIAEGTTAVTTVAATDPDGGTTLVYSISGGADQLKFAIDSGTGALSFLSAPDFETPTDTAADGSNTYIVEVQAFDGVTTDTQLITVHVSDVNAAPAITSATTSSTSENVSIATVVYDINATDDGENSNTLIYSISGTDAAQFNVNPSTGEVTFATSPNFEVPEDDGGDNVYDIVVHANDGSFDTTQAVAITVTDVNAAPAITSATTASTPENLSTATTVYDINATDDGENSNTLIYSISGTDAAQFNVNPSTGEVTFATSPNFEAPADDGGDNVYDIIVHANDGSFDTTQAVAITVTDLNVAPAITSATTANATEDAPAATVVYDINATDDGENSNTLIFSISGTDAGQFNVNSSTGEVTFVTSPDFDAPADDGGNNVYDIIVHANDGSFDTTQAVAITVVRANTTPVANDDAVSATEQGGLNNAVAGVDPTGNLVTGTGAAGAVADTDAEDASTALTVVAVGNGPEGQPDNGTVGIVLAGLYGFLTLNSNGSYGYAVDQTNTTVQGLHTFADTLPDVFHYTIQDTGGAQDTATLTITLHGANDLPQAVADTGSMTEDAGATPFIVLSNDTLDPDSTAANTIATGVVTASGPAGTSIDATDVTVAVIGGTQVQVTLGADFQRLATGETATVTVPYTLTGDAGDISTANLVVTVDGANDVPTANDDTGGMSENAGATLFDVRSNDTLDIDHTAPNSITIGTVSASGPAGDGITGADVTTAVVGNQVQITLGTDFQKLGGGETATIDVAYTLQGDQPGDTDGATLTVTVTGANDAPVAADVTFNGANAAIGNTALVVNDSSDGAPDPAGPQKTISGDLLGAATDVDTALGSLTITPATISNASGSITFEADGDFTYLPSAGFTGDAVFNYTLNDNDPSGNLTDTGTVTINVAAPKVWYVDDSAAAGGDGTSDNPFNSLTALSTGGSADGLDGANDIIFLYNGTYNSGIVLEDGQQLISQSHGLTVSGTTLEAASGSNSLINGNVTLASGNTIQGIDFGTTTGFALSGTNVGNAVVNTVTAGSINNTTGGAVSITGGSGTGMNLQFTSVSSTNSGGSAIQLDNARGTFNASGGTLSNATNADVSITGNNSSDDVSFTYGGTISDDVGALVSISGQTGGTKDFNGAITDGNDGDGSGISLLNNTGATIRFDGGLTLSTGANAAFTATGGGTVAVTDANGSSAPNNTIVTTSGTALNVANTTIHADDLTFQSISAGTGAGSAGVGISLDNTGTLGGLHVTGNGSAGSGGTIQNKTGGDGSTTGGIGIYLNNTSDVQLNQMLLHDFQNFGIRGFSVNGFTLANSTINATGSAKNGTSDAANEGSMKFGTDDLVSNGLTGTASITNSSIEDGFENNFEVFNHTGSLNLTVTGSTFRDTSTVGPGNAGLRLQADGTANITATITTSSFIANRARGIQVINQGSGAVDVDIGTAGVAGSGGTFTDNTIAIDIDQNGSGPTNFNILNATFTTANVPTLFGAGGAGSPINIFMGAAASPVQRGLFTGNIVGNNINNSNSLTGPGINVNITGTDPDGGNIGRFKIDSNVISNVSNFGILVATADGNATVDATITNNTVSTTTAGALQAIRVNAGATSSQAGAPGTPDNGTINLDVSGNNTTVDPAAGVTDILIRQRFNTTFRLEDYAGGQTDDAAVAAYLSARNNGNSADANHVATGSNGFLNINDVTEPPVPLLAAAGGVASSSNAPGDHDLTQAELAPIVSAALAHWAAAGLTAGQLATLQGITFTVADFSGGALGLESGGHIQIDSDAAGYGWFIDPTPGDNVEFAHVAGTSGTDLFTEPAQAPAGHMDLLTVVMHEMGHQLGLEDSYAPADIGDLMYGYLVAGERRLPDAADAAQGNTAASDAREPEHAQPAAGSDQFVFAAPADPRNLQPADDVAGLDLPYCELPPPWQRDVVGGGPQGDGSPHQVDPAVQPQVVFGVEDATRGHTPVHSDWML